jgi:sugar lactone lactonase YvrE
MSNATKMMMASAGTADTGAWDLDNAAYNGSPWNWFYLGDQNGGTDFDSVVFKPDGTKMYALGSQTRVVYEYDLNTAWVVTTASYVQSFSVGTQETNPQAMYFKPDGTKMYVVGTTADAVFQYDLSTAWDLSTASYVQSFSVSSQETNPTSLSFKTDGTRMYVAGLTNNRLYMYNLSTAWDISTASYSGSNASMSTTGTPSNIYFKDDGTKLYKLTITGSRLYTYTLSTAWTVSSMSYDGSTYSFPMPNGTEKRPQGVYFKSDGTAFYIVGDDTACVWKVDVSTAWDLSTASFSFPTTDYFNIVNEETSPTGLFLSPDGTRMYITGTLGDAVRQYSLSTAGDVGSQSFVQSFSVSAQETFPSSVFFKPDGTKMYVLGDTGDDVNQYNLSTAWDISTAVYYGRRYVGSFETAPKGLFIGNNGTKMYIVGTVGDDVNEFTLSTAWEVATASYTRVKTLSATPANPTGIFFKSDGTKMYVVGYTKNVYEYSLSTAWNVSTMTYSKSYTLEQLTADNNLEDITFNGDGTKMLVITSNLTTSVSFTRAIYGYDIGL